MRRLLPVIVVIAIGVAAIAQTPEAQKTLFMKVQELAVRQYNLEQVVMRDEKESDYRRQELERKIGGMQKVINQLFARVQVLEKDGKRLKEASILMHQELNKLRK